MLMSANDHPTSDKVEKTENSLFKVMTWATAFSFGVMTALLASITDLKAFTLAFGFRTLVGFALGWAAGWALWAWVKKASAQNPEEPK